MTKPQFDVRVSKWESFTLCEGPIVYSQKVNYHSLMVVVTHKHLLEAAAEYPDAAAELAALEHIIEESQWQSFVELRATVPDADAVDGYVIFNVRGTRYRLITVMHYARTRGDRLTQGHCYIRSFLTHKQYDKKSNWDKEYGS